MRRCAVVYLAVVLGAGMALHSVHPGSCAHGHRYCAEHDRIEAVGHGDAHDGDGRRVPDGTGIRAGETAVPDAHVACALLNALAARSPFAAETGSASVPAAEGVRAAAALVDPFDPFGSILSNAPKTSPPISPA